MSINTKNIRTALNSNWVTSSNRSQGNLIAENNNSIPHSHFKNRNLNHFDTLLVAQRYLFIEKSLVHIGQSIEKIERSNRKLTGEREFLLYMPK